MTSTNPLASDPHNSTRSTQHQSFLMQIDLANTETATGSPHDEDTDEYSDFGEDPEALEIIDQLLLEATGNSRQEQKIAPLVVTDIEDYEAPRGVRLPKVLGLEAPRQWNLETRSVEGFLLQNVLDQSPSQRPSSANEEDARTGRETSPQPTQPRRDAQQEQQPSESHARSPLDRFRKPPMKALSVTDLISPAWCELQYYYVLTKHGRKRRTPAMKQGSAVHQALEDEIHVTVPVEITKREDSWGLRIWNIVQGLKTLRENGKTRELEIWGSIGGEIVNGVIDELSYECPDPKLEDMSRRLLEKKEVEPPLPEYQASIRDYLVTNETRDQGQSLSEALKNGSGDISKEAGSRPTTQRTRNSGQDDERRIYITDVKTRGTPTLPTGSAIRPTLVQLHLYHHMLEGMAQGQFPLSHLAERYKFDIHETFSDPFIAQIGGLNQEVYELSQQSDDARQELPPSTQDSVDILLQHNTLASLWDFMMEQFRLTFIIPSSSASVSAPLDPNSSDQNQDPNVPPPSSLSALPTPPSQPTRLSPILTARYISHNYKHHSITSGAAEAQSHILGSKSVLFNPSFFTSSLYSSLAFWKGEREARGVEVIDAWKCRICEFRDECVWVRERDENMVREARERRRLKEELEDGEPGEGKVGRRSRV
ncbi:uncharacterized protein Z520_00370 [Fonsecaea multimorphosa CBS 102226]|uniref:Exonuclease V, mitochondrial n=1 Tax=Fonsecaea multimorphosa CBS 102226 TaxID=1442371 RepID=A0A0D2L3Q3_9EURO|nr:uncharacterized protein Z520_00370 [Fonsecaea multimorphosa CBS 102226]KIY03679.1 hypothetical protein Z520_00370 [Fonsecaea multimorphosa CBS 102226]OAL32378.1 hypothetical protein AYO22_00400 [Fonsecaea multimorphosa]